MEHPSRINYSFTPERVERLKATPEFQEIATSDKESGRERDKEIGIGKQIQDNILVLAALTHVHFVPARVRWSDRSWDGLFLPFPYSPATADFPVSVPGRLPRQSFRGLLDVHSRYGLPDHRTTKRSVVSKASAISSPPSPLR
jgi:hypothetical protein